MTQCVITVKDNRLYFEGDVPVDAIKDCTSWEVQGAKFSQAYKRGIWDGRKSLFNKKTMSCPAGLLEIVLDHLRATHPVLRITLQEAPQAVFPGWGVLGVGGKLKGRFGLGIFDYQMEAAKAAIDKKRGILKLAVNAGKTACAAAIINYWKLPTIFMVPGIELLYQTLETLSDLLEIPKENIGLIGDGNFSVGDWLTIATADSLHSKLFGKEIPKELKEVKWECLIVDEVHGGSATTWYEIMDVIPAEIRIGLSGTPYDRSDGNTLQLVAQTGPMLYEVTTKLLVERGISLQPLVKLIPITEPQIPKKRNKIKVTYAEAYEEGITNNLMLNEKIVEELIAQLDQGKQVIVMVDRIEHGTNILVEYILKSDCTKDAVHFLHGTVDSDTRKQTLQDFKDGKIRAIIATSILNQGVDMDCIDTLLLVGGGKAVIPLLQRVGRGLRTGKGRKELLIIDFMNSTHKFFAEHSAIRLETYRLQDCFKFIK